MGRNHQENEKEKRIVKTSCTALDVVLTAWDEDRRHIKSLDFFSFRYGEIEVSFNGQYYGYARHAGAGHDEEEFGAWSFGELLDCRPDLTGKTLREMLSGLDASELELIQSDFGPTSDGTD